MTNNEIQLYQDIYQNHQNNSCEYNDDEYMQQTVKAMYRVFSNNCMFAIKNKNSTYLAASESFAQLVGMTTQNIIGTTEIDFKCSIKNYHKTFYNQDRLVEINRQKLTFLDIYRYTKNTCAYITRKLPIINPKTNNVLGCYLILSTLKPNLINKIIKNIHLDIDLEYYHKISANLYTKFSQREIEIMFCISIGIIERKKIALFLSKIHNKSIKHDATIKSSLKSIYNKLPNINSISELSNYVEYSNFSSQIPTSILKIGSYLVSS